MKSATGYLFDIDTLAADDVPVIRKKCRHEDGIAHDCAYVTARERLISRAEQCADEITGLEPEGPSGNGGVMRHATGNLWDWHDRGAYVVIPTNIGWRRDGSNPMGKGIAKQAAEKFSHLPVFYGQWCQSNKDGFAVRSDMRLVLFPTKSLNVSKPHLSWRGMSSLKLIEKSTASMIGWHKARPRKKEEVALPLVGCGEGGLLESDVLPILERYLDDRFVLVRQT